MKNFTLILFCFLITCSNLFAVDRFYLNDGWEFRKVGDSVWYPATVPGTVHTDLYNNGLIPDPFYRNNEKDLQWIENEDWEYRCEFNVSDSVYNQSNIDITFEGLDTYAKVYLNDSLIITADNMFRKWQAECKKFITKGKNKLYILFESPVRKAKELKSGPELPGGDRVYTRKAAYQYGWDFGPRFVTSGIWKKVYIENWSIAKIKRSWCNVNLSYSFDDAIIEIGSETFVDSPNGIYSYQIRNLQSGELVTESVQKINLRQEQLEKIQGRCLNAQGAGFSIKNPLLWWCNGYGKQNFYHFLITLSKNGEIVDRDTIKVGIRKIEIVQDSSKNGRSFYFKLNGIPIFIKGANYIPQDNFLSRISQGKYEKIIDDAAESNINMLRVWGGGIYGDEDFYNLCDEKGILVWQDFMFANGMYPGNSDFLDNSFEERLVNQEILNRHPCWAIYCGNNEIEEGWKNWGWQKEFNMSAQDSIKIWNDYRKLFEMDYINKRIWMYTEGYYIPTSPKIGWGHPEAMREGDSHYWGVWWGMEPFEMYEKKIPRFMSEYGFQGFPDIKTIEQFTLPEDRYLYSPVMKAHQKHPTGYETIQTYMEREYKQPKDFENYVYVSQLLQAYGIKRAIEAHRRAKPYCMGTMYWQLDDCWPGITWSGIDYYGRWKAMQYFVKEAYKDILISIHEENDSVKVWVVSDRVDTTIGDLRINLAPLNPPEGGKLGSGFDLEKSIILKPNSSSVYFVISKNDLIEGHSLNDIVLSAKFIDDEGKEYKNLYYFVPPKELALENPEISYDFDSDNGELVLSTKKIAKNVHIEIDDVSAPLNLENNYFDMLPGETVRLNIGNSIEKSKIKVTSLYDVF